MSTSTPLKKGLTILYDPRDEDEKEEALELLNKLASIVEHTPFDYVIFDIAYQKRR